MALHRRRKGESVAAERKRLGSPLPKQASATAKARAKGQQGARKKSTARGRPAPTTKFTPKGKIVHTGGPRRGGVRVSGVTQFTATPSQLAKLRAPRRGRARKIQSAMRRARRA